VVLSDKYIAGFFDGDGALSIDSNRLMMEFHQKSTNDGVIDLVSQWFPGGTRDERTGCRRGTVTYAARLRFTGQKAVDRLCRLKPYLVTKRIRANRLLFELGFTKRVGTDSMPVYPSRKWLAGYFDADGCVFAGLNQHGGSASGSRSRDPGEGEPASRSWPGTPSPAASRRPLPSVCLNERVYRLLIDLYVWMWRMAHPCRFGSRCAPSHAVGAPNAPLASQAPKGRSSFSPGRRPGKWVPNFTKP
jgi:hypothetical protein